VVVVGYRIKKETLNSNKYVGLNRIQSAKFCYLLVKLVRDLINAGKGREEEGESEITVKCWQAGKQNVSLN
jgi:hypothetical protein